MNGMKGHQMNTKTAHGTMIFGALALLLGGCEGAKVVEQQPNSDMAMATKVSDALMAACPVANADDEDARHLCAARLTDDKYLPSVMREPFLWGGQKAGASYHPEESPLTRFSVFVWRRMYLSLIMFTGERRIEQTADGLTVVHLTSQFRNDLQMGSYPYPFWHSKKKWDSYEHAKETLLIFQDGQWVGAMRGVEQDAAKPHVAHTWSGQWQWETGAQPQPYVTLYSYLFSKANPHVERVDAAYRALSEGMRNQACFMCHAPDNYAQSTKLEFFNYPNQALYARNDIVSDLEKNAMPPVANTLGFAGGIKDPTERAELLALAREFKAAGDQALAYEGELKPAPGPTGSAMIP
jgi:hypothetical protein